MQFKNSFQNLPSLFFENVVPTPLTKPQLVIVSSDCRQLLNCQLSDENLLLWLNGELRLKGDQRISTRYAGHQFGVWAGQLGDGRAISLGEVDCNHQKWEIQTKGSGLTPFSRMGDGKAVVRSSVREFLASEAMHFLGVPTTRALALITGEDAVERETIEKSALVARVFPSNLRFGHFEYAYHFGYQNELDALTNYAREFFFAECNSLEEMLLEIVLRTAKLIAKWQSIGFCHGVMNSDNMSLLGLTIDYGPFGFMQDFQPNWICNHSDSHGRYTYHNQPYIALWNLDRLLVCFSKKLPTTVLQEILAQFEPVFLQAHTDEFSAKLGLQTKSNEDTNLIQELLTLMAEKEMDFTFTFRNILNFPESTWRKKYLDRLAQEKTPENILQKNIHGKNPKYILRNYIAQEIIAEVESGQTQKITEWLKILSSPFAEHPKFDSYAKPTPKNLQHIEISCSS